MTGQATVNRTLRLPTLHPTQRKVFTCTARYRVVAKGRRWGGSFVGVVEATAAGYQGGNVWFISRDYSNAYERWQEIKRAALQIDGAKVSESRFEVVYPSGGVLTVKSAHDPDSLRGAGLDFIVLDEYAYTPKAEYLWRNVISPMLATTKGRALIMSSPNGVGNFFYTLYGYGLDPAMTDWQSFLYTSADNPLVPTDWLESQRSELPERVYQQEYLSIFIPDGTGVFRGVLDVCTAKPQYERIADHSYIMVIDWGRSNDFTAITVIDTTTRTEVQLDRFTDTRYSIQRDRIWVLFEKWQPDQVWAESNSIGGPNIEALQADGIPVHPFNTTNASKAEAVNALALAIERTSQGLDNGITLLDDPVGIAELQAYESDISPSGLIRFGARSGSHDDTVIARAIAVKQMTKRALPVFKLADKQTYQPEYDKSQGDVFWSIADSYLYSDGGKVQPMPRVVLVAQVTSDSIHIIAEHYDTTETDYQSMRTAVLALGYGDPILTYHQAQDQTLRSWLYQNSMSMTPTEYDTTEAIRLTRAMLDGDPARLTLRIHPRCVNLLSELSNYQYAERTTTGELKPMQGNDQGIRALLGLCWRYRWITPAAPVEIKQPSARLYFPR